MCSGLTRTDYSVTHHRKNSLMTKESETLAVLSDLWALFWECKQPFDDTAEQADEFGICTKRQFVEFMKRLQEKQR